LRRSSREIVDGERPSCRAISRTPEPVARRIAISSRSANDKYRPVSGAWVTGAIPPPSRNHRTPTGPDTPASAAASSLDTPRAIAAQNRCRCSRRPIGGRPGDPITGRPARSQACTFLPIATPPNRALRQPLESALAALIGVPDQSGHRPATLQGHLQGVGDQFGAHVIVHRPADDPA